MQRFVALLGLISLLSACGTAQDLSSTHDDSGSVIPGTFKLYTTPDKTPNPSCDVFTSMTLVNGTVAPVAILENKVKGECEIAVNAAQRVYNLNEQDAGCGSKLYTGDGIEVLDHRERTCRDIVDAEIIVTETTGTRAVTLYTSMRSLADVSVSGHLVQIAAIGGETTGHGIQTADGRLIEVDLATGGFVSSFVDGQAVSVAGFQKTVTGVEMPFRDVLVVTALTLL